MKKIVKLTERDLTRIVRRVINEGLYGKSNIIIEQSTNSGNELEKILISKFVDENQPRIGVEYKDPSIRDDFFNEYSSEYQSWLAKNGFKMSDINLESGVDQSRLSQISNLIKQKGWDRAVAAKKLDMSKQQDKINTTNDRTYDYKLSNGKYYYSLKGQNKWVEAKGKGLEHIKTKIKF
jgi:hypothetical protein